MRDREIDDSERIFFRIVDMFRSYVEGLEYHHTFRAKASVLKDALTIRALPNTPTPIQNNPAQTETLTGVRVLHRIWRQGKKRQPLKSPEDLKKIYQQIFAADHARLAPYFRLLFNAFNYLSKADCIEDKRRYSRILRAILSPPELYLLAGNCLSDNGKPFTVLVVEFDLLQHIPDDEGISIDEIKAEVKRLAIEFEKEQGREPASATD
jgi:hypothetical protein